MFKTFFFTELRYSLKQPMIYIFLVLMGLFVFGATASDSIIIGGTVGNVFKNAPHIITVYTTIMCIFGLLIAAAFFNNAALRDYNNDFNEILFSTPLSKAGYFFGRFFGALILATIPLLGVFLGSLIGTFLSPLFGWVDPERFGPFYLETFVNNYFLFILPNMFFAGTIIYAMANKWRSTVISFVGALVIIIGYIISGVLISDIDNEMIAALTDTFGIRAYSLYAKYYTPIEKNTLSPQFTGFLLYNRLIWVFVGSIILLLSYFSFSFQEKNKKVRKSKKEASEKGLSFSLPSLHPVFNKRTEWKQFKSFFSINFKSISRSVTFNIMFLFSAIILISNLLGGFEYFGLQAYPLTYKLVDLISGATSIFVVIILVFFSGELVWRDRDFKISEVIDATPSTSFISMAAKALSLIAVTSLLHFFFIFVAVVYQLINGYTRIELDVYFMHFLLDDLPLYAIWSAVMIMIQVIFNNKYIGYFVSVAIIFIWSIMLSIFDVSSNMLSIAAGPSTTYSDMNGFGPGLNGSLWFNLYWLLFAFISLLIAGSLWNRGLMSSLKERILHAKKQLPRAYRILLFISILAWIGVASFVYYNTQILNPYKTSDERELIAATYEKTYKKYQHIAMPKVTKAKYEIDIFPNKRDFYAKSTMDLTNQTDQAIDSIHFNLDQSWNTEINIPQAELVFNDEELGYQIYALAAPLDSGETITIEINSSYITKGFENEQGNTNIVRNGTFVNNFEFLPGLGYNESVELSDKNTRKKYDLGPKDRMPKLEEDCSDACMANYLSDGRSDYIPIESIVSTAGDQIAVAPGSLIKQWKENGRNYFHYKVDQPSQNFYSVLSARFEVASRKWNGIDIEVYYDKKHDINIEMMLDAVERSLSYYTENFGPYYHKQCRIIEFPRYATFAQAFPGSMPYSEAFGFIINLEDEEENNVIDAVISHEMAHQWWAHQVIGANMQGGTMLSESFSEYSALMTMKKISKTPMKMREFIKYDHNRYLRGRSSETDIELPLYQVENQGHIHYGKGSVILYALQDYIGEEKVNRAMRGFLEEYRYQEPPYPTSLDFLRYLEPEVPDSLAYLIDDWFKEITLYDNRLNKANYMLQDNGKYLVSIDIESYKLRADSMGNESKIAIDDWIDIGLFADSDEEILMYEERVKINENNMSFSFEVDSLPAKAAIDPRMLLIDRVYKDNVKTVSEK